MAYAGITPGVGGINALRERWDARFQLKGFEEGEVYPDFGAPEGVKDVGEQIHIRIIPAVTAQSASDSAELDPTALTYVTDTILEVTEEPIYRYCVVGLPNNLIARLGEADTASLEAGYRELMLGGLNAAVDSNAASLFTSVAAIKGPANADLSLIVDMQGTLATNAKNHVKAGKTPMHLKFHPSQLKYINVISQFASAEQRGDKENPNVGGVIVKAMGMTYQETGSINFSGGFYWNALFAKSFAVFAANRKPRMLDRQPYGLTNLMLGETDFLNVEVFDEDCVAWKSA